MVTASTALQAATPTRHPSSVPASIVSVISRPCCSNSDLLKRIAKGARSAAANLLLKLIRAALQHPLSTPSWRTWLEHEQGSRRLTFGIYLTRCADTQSWRRSTNTFPNYCRLLHRRWAVHQICSLPTTCFSRKKEPNKGIRWALFTPAWLLLDYWRRWSLD